MRVLVVHHGALPDGASATTGGAIRAAQHTNLLRAAGHEVTTLYRAQDGAGGYQTPRHLRRLAAANRPDWVLCVAPEEAPALRGVAPLVVDLYAPRMLEAAWEGQQQDEAQRALLAVDAADEVIFSNARQRWFWLGVLGLAGWDLQQDVGLVVPLAVTTSAPPARPRRPRVIVGGHPWPWQDARETLRRATEHLGDRAEVVSFGLPAVDGVDARPLASRQQWQAALVGSTVALDRYAPHAERALALSFRQMDYLGAGLPLVSDPGTPLAASLRRTGAGWVDEPLEAALDAALSEDRRAQVAALAAEFAPDRVGAPLLALRPAPRVRSWTAVRGSRQAAQALVEAQADRARRVSAEAEVVEKREEVRRLVAQVAALTGSVEALARAQADVTAFRRETVAVLGTRLEGQTEEAECLRRDLAILRADLDKKDLELAQMHRERDRLGGVLRRLGR